MIEVKHLTKRYGSHVAVDDLSFTVDAGPGIANSEIRKITIERNSGEEEDAADKLTLRYFTDGLAEADPTESVSMFMEPDDGSYIPVDSAMQSSILSSVTGLEYESTEVYQADEAAVTEYGFAEPLAVLTVEYQVEIETEAASETEVSETESGEGDESETAEEPVTVIEDRMYRLYVGSEDEEQGVYYVMYEGGESVLTMDMSSLDALLEIDRYDLANLTPLEISETTIDKIEIGTSERIRVLTVTREEVTVETESQDEDADQNETTASGKTQTETVVTYMLDGQEITATEFGDILDMLQIQGERPLQAEEVTAEESELSVIFTRNVSSYPTVTVSYIPYSSSYYQAALDGADPSIAVNIRDVQAILDWMEE